MEGDDALMTCVVQVRNDDDNDSDNDDNDSDDDDDSDDGVVNDDNTPEPAQPDADGEARDP